MAVKAHPFMPQGWQNPTFLLWLRRTHGWIGLLGAAFGIMYSVTTLFMEHDNFGLSDVDTVVKSEIVIPANASASLDTFVPYIKKELGARNDWRPLRRNITPESMEESGDYGIRFVSPGKQISVTYSRGDSAAAVTKTDRAFAKTVNRLHRSEGVTMTWKIIADAFTFALLFLAVTGIMMWARNHGTRWLAVGLFAVSTGIIFFTATVNA